MHMFSKIVISVPLLAGAWMVGIGSMNAAVQELGPTEAVELLARSEAIDAKCRHLSQTEHQELSDYVAKAEVAVAAQTSVERASNAITQGAATGKASPCGRDSEITVRATMDAARRAIAASHNSDQSMSVASANTKKQPAAANASRMLVRMTGNAVSYSRLAAAYYVEHRCKHLSHAQAVDFWQRIVSMHNSVLSSQGPDALSSAKTRAIRRAKATGGCSSNTAKLVRASYRTIKQK